MVINYLIENSKATGDFKTVVAARTIATSSAAAVAGLCNTRKRVERWPPDAPSYVTLVTFYARHIRQFVCNAFVAINAGLLATGERRRVLFRSAQALRREIHVIEVMAVAAFQRVVRFQSCPFMFRELSALCVEFVARVDRAEYLSPDVLGRCCLARNFLGPVMRDVAIRARGPYTRTIGEVNRVTHLLVHVLGVFMATNTEFLGIGRLQRCVEAAPEDDACDEATEG